MTDPAEKKETGKRPRGRPVTRTIKLDATPERVAQALFSAVKSPDPSLRKSKRRRSGKPAK